MLDSLNDLKQGMGETETRLFDTSKFLGKMLFAGLFFRGILYLYPETYGLQSFLAHFTAVGLNLIGVEVVREGTLLIDSSSIYVVNQDCLGWKSMAAFTALVFSSPGKVVSKLRPVLIGLVALVAINYVRIVTTVALSHYQIIPFEIIHTLFWKWGLTGVVVLSWAFWLKYYNTGPDSGNL